MLNTWITLAKTNDIPPESRFSDSENVIAEEIGDGNLNDVTRLLVKQEDGQIRKSLIVKHSLPYIKCLGTGYPLTEERILYEYRALVEFNRLSPGSVPQPYMYDPSNFSVYMEDLRGYTLLRHQLMEGVFDLQIAENLARKLAVVHRETHINTIGTEKLQGIDKQFNNTSMIDLTRQYVFTRPFSVDDETNRCSDKVRERLDTIYKDDQVLQTAQRMLSLFMERKECLLHGDLHTGSIMVKDADARMFDVEFAFVGPAAFDVGMLLANFIFSYYRHMGTEEDNDMHRQFAYKMIDACKTFVNVYLEHQTALQDNQQEEFMTQVAGFAGCELVRRLVGAAHNADLEGMPLAEQDCLGSGVRLLQAVDRIHNVDRMMVIALMLA